MKLSAILEPLIAAGVPGDVILATVRAYEEQAAAAADQGKEKARERWRRWKNKQGTNVGKRLQTATNNSRGGDARGLDNLQTKKISGQEEKTNTAPKARESDLSAFKAELADLDAERVEAIVKHRRSKRGQLTGLAARLFRADAEACGLSISQAVDTCISRNWITVKPEYLAGKQARATAPPKPQTVGDMFREDARRMGLLDEPDNTSQGRLEAGDGSGENLRTGGPILLAIAPGFRRTG
jgi:hypothetical protein